MDYEAAAEELLEIYGELSHKQYNRQMDRYARGELLALTFLAAHEGHAYPKEISRGMAVSSARVAVLLNHLESKGYICRTSDEADNRQIIVTLTEAGRALILQKKNEAKVSLIEMLQVLGEEDTQAYLRIRRKMLAL